MSNHGCVSPRYTLEHSLLVRGRKAQLVVGYWKLQLCIRRSACALVLLPVRLRRKSVIFCFCGGSPNIWVDFIR
jgi:hypothetical protein